VGPGLVIVTARSQISWTICCAFIPSRLARAGVAGKGAKRSVRLEAMPRCAAGSASSSLIGKRLLR